MTSLLKSAYAAGRQEALSDAGVHSPVAVFTDFAKEDEDKRSNREPASFPDDPADKPVNWSTHVSLDSGDVGTRTMPTGNSGSGAV